MNREDLKLIPMAVYGISRGVLEYIIKPRIIEDATKVQTMAKAAIHYYNTDQGEN